MDTMTVKEVAAYLNVHPGYVRNLVRFGLLPRARTVDARTYLIARESVLAFQARRRKRGRKSTSTATDTK
jgi:excisionase family DNA binding protein